MFQTARDGQLRAAMTGAFFIALVVCAACGDPAPAGGTTVDGTFVATTPGEIDVITFERDGHYALRRQTTKVIESGTYEMHDGGMLALTDERTGSRHELRFAFAQAAVHSRPMALVQPGPVTLVDTTQLQLISDDGSGQSLQELAYATGPGCRGSMGGLICGVECTKTPTGWCWVMG